MGDTVGAKAATDGQQLFIDITKATFNRFMNIQRKIKSRFQSFGYCV
jgi:hypothetical protein